MKLKELTEFAVAKSNFTRLEHSTEFARRLLGFVSDDGVQAEIVCQNDDAYRFFQFREDGHHNVSRPVNARLLLSEEALASWGSRLGEFLGDPSAAAEDEQGRRLLCNGIYTLQQSIGIALDALPAGRSNTARKVNGDLFERLIQILIRRSGVTCDSGTVRLPVRAEGNVACLMNFQQDLILQEEGAVRAIGSVKTSSKDRIGKIFVDKLLFNKLSGAPVPHFAIFLNDVQRGRRSERSFPVSNTFLPGHFKGYTISLNPLDGVYDCDLNHGVSSDPFLGERIFTIDRFFCEDLHKLMATAPRIDATIREDDDSREVSDQG